MAPLVVAKPLFWDLLIYFGIVLYLICMSFLIYLYYYQIGLMERLRLYLRNKFPNVKFKPFIHPFSIDLLSRPWQFISQTTKFFTGKGLTINFRLVFSFGSRKTVKEYLSYILDYKKLIKLKDETVDKCIEKLSFAISISSNLFLIAYLYACVILAYAILSIIVNYI